jgi:hypothetical protein
VKKGQNWAVWFGNLGTDFIILQEQSEDEWVAAPKDKTFTLSLSTTSSIG